MQLSVLRFRKHIKLENVCIEQAHMSTTQVSSSIKLCMHAFWLCISLCSGLGIVSLFRLHHLDLCTFDDDTDVGLDAFLRFKTLKFNYQLIIRSSSALSIHLRNWLESTVFGF